MSADWSFYSFDFDRFGKLFGGGSDASAEALVEVLTDEDYFDFDDPEIAEAVARRVVAEGFSYDGADEEEQEILDCIPDVVFKVSDVLTEFVAAKPESPGGFHVNVVSELHNRAQGKVDLELLLLFDGGRRFGGAPSEYCEHILFTPAEVVALLDEARRVVDIEAEWSHPGFPGEIEKELLGPLRKVAEANRGLAAFFP